MTDKDKIEKLKNSFQNIEVPSEVDLAVEKGIQRAKAHRKGKWIKTLSMAAACIVVAAAASTFVVLNKDQKTASVDSKIKAEKSLPVVGSVSQLMVLLKDFENGYVHFTVKDQAKESRTLEKSKDSYSPTNVQVNGVDEADTVKTDGKYIYKINGNSVLIIQAYPVQEMKEVSKIEDKNIWVRELFIKDQYLVILGHADQKMNEPTADYEDTFHFMQQTICRVYDISNKIQPKLVREVKLDGFYHTSRMIGSQIYFISNKNLRWGPNMEKSKNLDDRMMRPNYSDSIDGGEEIAIGYDKIQYCPEAIAPNYIMIGSFNIESQKEKVKITSVLGSGDNVYVSEKNIYIAGTKQGAPIRIFTDDTAVKSEEKKPSRMMSTIYKFSLNEGNVKFIVDGKVPGSTLNQFSMDENNGYLRVGTTEYIYDSKERMQSHLYILDNSMKVTGKIENIAPGERIYSTRFIGDKGYMVTFKQTDPLFVIDLKNPSQPKILGELKIPGFSNYLHPYDENHIIGFGQDTQEANGVVKTNGMKIALFDVTDVHHPKQLFVEKIGGAGTYSELFNNHKALLFSKEKNLMAFPITVMLDTHNQNDFDPSFVGAYVYSLDLEKGFVLKDKISHKDIAELALKKQNNKRWQNGYYSFVNVERAIFIEDALYTVSPFGIKVNHINTIKEIRKLTFDKLPYIIAN